MNWQPIETAPKDGSSILAYNATSKKMILLEWRDYEDSWCVTWNGQKSDCTHWMPLPEPPLVTLWGGRILRG
jgi:hypothetical protein